MLDSINFHSCYGHNGDIHFSREFIKHFVKHIPARRYFYTHTKSRRSTLDIPGLQYHQATRACPGHTLWELRNNKLDINVWCGCRNNRFFGFFDRIRPYEGTFIRANYHMFTTLILELKSVNINVSPLKHMLHYIPSIDYSYYETKEIDKFVLEHPGTKILICNGNCMCNQISNFSFNDLIKSLSADKNLTVIVTEARKIPGVYFTGDIIKKKGGDLNEISYLSRFCSIIIGRGSGPFCFSEVKENVHDINKRMIGITNDRGWAFWWHNPKNMRWTSNYRSSNLINMVHNSLQEIKLEKSARIKCL